MSSIEVQVAGAFRSARSVRPARTLDVKADGGYSAVTLPALNDYDVIVLE
jgi:hypothetical protein